MTAAEESDQSDYDSEDTSSKNEVEAREKGIPLDKWFKHPIECSNDLPLNMETLSDTLITCIYETLGWHFAIHFEIREDHVHALIRIGSLLHSLFESGSACLGSTHAKLSKALELVQYKFVVENILSVSLEDAIFKCVGLSNGKWPLYVETENLQLVFALPAAVVWKG